MSRSVRPRATRLTRIPPPSGALEASSQQPVSPLESILHEMRTKKPGRSNLLGASLESALEAVWGNRTRSFLTMLGIVIGISAVIGALTLTQGVGAYISGVISGLGSNTISVQPGSSSNSKSQSQVIRPLTDQDLQSLSKLPHVIASSPRNTTRGQIVYGSQNWQTRVVGVSTDMQTIQSWNLAQGIWFTSADENGGQSVAVLGDTVYQQLFATLGVDPIGQKILINGEVFRVVGVLAPKGQSGFGVSDDVIFIPYKAQQVRLTNANITMGFNEIDLQADSADNVNLVVQEITTVLELHHRIPRGSPDDFQTVTSQQRLQQSSQATQAITLLLTGVAAISLSVGGIGIMNIMLVSVTERTREIGIRMSIGARRSDIRNQFLIEALVLCLLGGLFGLLLGVLIGWASVSAIAAAASGGTSSASVPLIITPTTLILPFGVSFAIGLVFGLYPAMRASRLDPIVALRKPR